VTVVTLFSDGPHVLTVQNCTARVDRHSVHGAKLNSKKSWGFSVNRRFAIRGAGLEQYDPVWLVQRVHKSRRQRRQNRGTNGTGTVKLAWGWSAGLRSEFARSVTPLASLAR